MPLNFLAKFALTAVMSATNMALTMTRRIEGPRLDDLKVTSGDYGNPLPMIWGKRRMQCPIIWAEDLKEVKQTRKTKGGKYNDYTYFGTWAVALAGHEIDSASRIWLDTHLVYDMTGAGPVTPFDFGTIRSGKGGGAAGAGGFAINDHMAIYLGTETQEADPRIQATVEAEFGEGSCPAYRGTAYLVFKDLPLEKVGNRIPQVSVEILSASTPAYPYEESDIPGGIDGANRLWGFAFSPDYSRFSWIDGDNLIVYDVAARSAMYYGTASMSLDPAPSGVGVANDGGLYLNADGGGSCLYVAPGSLTATTFFSYGDSQEGVFVKADGNGNEYVLTAPFSTYTEWYKDGVAVDYGTWRPVSFFTDQYGDIWAVGSAATSATTAYFKRIVACGESPHGTDEYTVTGLSSSTLPEVAAVHYKDDTLDQFVFEWNSTRLGILDLATGTATTGSYSLDVYTTFKQFQNCPPGASSIWLNWVEYSLKDLSVLRTVTRTDWSSRDADGIIYDPINHALITFPQITDKIMWRYLDRISGDGVTLGTIAADVADMVGIDDYDFTALDQTIPGWSATQGQASNILEPLFDTYASRLRPHDFELQGIKRSGVSGGSILTERFVGDPRYTVKVRQAAELPRAITVNFADTDADQQPNSARADRPLDATGARGEQTLDMQTLALDKDTAKQLVDRYHRDLWNGRREVSNSLTAQQLSLEPGDCRTLSLDGASDIYELQRITIKANDELACEWRYDAPTLITLNGASGANFDGRNPSTIIVAGIAKGFVLDIPLIRDVDESASPPVYIAAASYGSGFTGVVVYEEVSGEYTEEIGSVDSASQATWGRSTTALSDANPWVWDRGHSVNVMLNVGTLTGTTEAAIDASPLTNLALLGAELFNFTTATLESDGSYTLSGLKRGRRGTEWATSTHAVGDEFLLLDNADAVDLGLSDVGTNLSFKAIMNGRTEAGTFPVALSPFSGASLKPYAPCHLNGSRNTSSGDWSLTWLRRTRVGGAWTSYTSMPLSEASEEYELEIMSGDTVVRTVTGLSSASYTYSSANQVTDFGANQLSLTFRIYQISDAVWRGFVASATVIGADDGSVTYIGGTTSTFGGGSEAAIALTGLTGGAGTAPVEGDVVVVAYAIAGTSNIDVALSSSGWTEVADLYADDTYDANLGVFYKVMGATPDTSVTPTYTGSLGNAGAVAIHVWRNVDPVTVLDVTSTTATGTNTGLADPPSITPVTAGSVILAIGAAAEAAGAVFTSALDHFLTAASPDNRDAMIGMGSHAWTTGAYDPAAFGGGTSDANASWTAVTLALRKAS